MLIGHGPDDWYERPARTGWASAYGRMPWALQRAGEAGIEAVGSLAWRHTHPARQVAALAMAGTDAVVLTAPRRRRLFADPTDVDAGQRRSRELVQEAAGRFGGSSPADRDRLVLSELLIPEMVRSCLARWSRTYDLAVRYPFLDRDVVEFMLRVDRPGTAKEHLRQLASRLMPPERTLAPKLHQTIPLAEWFRGPLRQFLLEGLSADRLAAAGTFDPTAVAQLVGEHLRGRRNHLWPLWCLLVVTEWQHAVLSTARKN